MIKNAKWIWLREKDYPNVQTTTNFFAKNYKEHACRFVEFEKEYSYDKQVEKILVEISADVKYFLYVNGVYVGVGPVTPGGDYNCELAMPQQYYNSYEIAVNNIEVRIHALVQTLPIVQCDMSRGRNGFICAVKILFEDGTEETVYSNETWRCRVSETYEDAYTVNFCKPQEEWQLAEMRASIWELFPSEIPNTVEEKILPQGERKVFVKSGEIKSIHYELDRIYSGYYAFTVKAEGGYQINIYDYEKEAEKSRLRFSVQGKESRTYRSVVMTSVGAFDVEIKNLGEAEIEVQDIALQFQHYPTLSQGDFICNDEELNKVYDMGRHALKICRQSIELDSPKHQENLQCAGDYHIASLMNYYADGDTKLTRFDILRIARYLEMSDGYMFHTTYGLIWVQMIVEYYRYSGDESLLFEVKTAVTKLLNRHASTTNESGIIDRPPNYMFVDWIDVDGYTMHHPPKALGQTVLNAFYYKALLDAATMYGIIGETVLKKECMERAERLKEGFSVFYDEEKGVYCDGLNDTDEEGGQWRPKNTEKRYYSWHSNTLAVLYDLAPIEKQKTLIERVLNDEGCITPQPYFMHFVLEAIDKVGLFERYGMKQLDRWKYMTEFGKGLEEGWVSSAAYAYDYSHVWAGTPTYQLPNKLAGLKVLKAGFKEISLSPKLYGLQWAKIRIPTPNGVIKIDMREGQPPILDIPTGIDWVVER